MSKDTMRRRKPVVLTFIAYYLPAYKSGGPVRSVSNIVERLGDEFEFRIVTADRDAKDTAAYPGIRVDEWNPVGKAMVFYVSHGRLSLRKVAGLAMTTDHQAVYLNSFFEPRFTMLPLLARRIGVIPRRPVIIAPRGEFSEGALVLKRWKKLSYQRVGSLLGLCNDAFWQASSELEAADIRRFVGVEGERILIAPNLASAAALRACPTSNLVRDDGPLRVAFLSRITPKKNLEFALRVIRDVTIPVEFSIYGPVSDESYWVRCQSLMASMPPDIRVTYHGSVPPDRVTEVLKRQDLFFLPTLGENYGHAIAEAAAAGVPLLVSDVTPWRNLTEAGVGWDLPLTAAAPFADAIHECASMSPDQYRAMRKRVREFALERLGDSANVLANRRLFATAVDGLESRASPMRAFNPR